MITKPASFFTPGAPAVVWCPIFYL